MTLPIVRSRTANGAVGGWATVSVNGSRDICQSFVPDSKLAASKVGVELATRLRRHEVRGQPCEAKRQKAIHEFHAIRYL
jgi:hypothetical protein